MIYIKKLVFAWILFLTLYAIAFGEYWVYWTPVEVNYSFWCCWEDWSDWCPWSRTTLLNDRTWVPDEWTYECRLKDTQPPQISISWIDPINTWLNIHHSVNPIEDIEITITEETSTPETYIRKICIRISWWRKCKDYNTNEKTFYYTDLLSFMWVSDYKDLFKDWKNTIEVEVRDSSLNKANWQPYAEYHSNSVESDQIRIDTNWPDINFDWAPENTRKNITLMPELRVNNIWIHIFAPEWPENWDETPSINACPNFGPPPPEDEDDDCRLKAKLKCKLWWWTSTDPDPNPIDPDPDPIVTCTLAGITKKVGESYYFAKPTTTYLFCAVGPVVRLRTCQSDGTFDGPPSFEYAHCVENCEYTWITGNKTYSPLNTPDGLPDCPYNISYPKTVGSSCSPSEEDDIINVCYLYWQKTKVAVLKCNKECDFPNVY